MDVETLITRRYDDIDIIKSAIPIVLQDLYPGRNTNIDITEVERLFVENAKNIVTRPIVEEVPEDIFEDEDITSQHSEDLNENLEEDSTEPQLEIHQQEPVTNYNYPNDQQIVNYNYSHEPVMNINSVLNNNIMNNNILNNSVSNNSYDNENHDPKFHKRNDHVEPEVRVVANKLDFVTNSGNHVKIERTEASYIPTTTTIPTPAYRQDYDKDKHISDLNEKIKQLESEKTSNAKRFLMMIRGEREQDRRRRRVRVYASEHGFELTEEDLDSFTQKEFDYIYSAIMRASNKRLYLLVYYALFINGLRIANQFIKKNKFGFDIQYIIDSITSEIFIEEMQDAMPEVLTTTISTVTQTRNPIIKLLYLILVRPLEVKLPSLLAGCK